VGGAEDGYTTPFIYTGGKLKDLRGLADYVAGINNAGEIVGWKLIENGDGDFLGAQVVLLTPNVTLLNSGRVWVKGGGGAPMSERVPAPPAPGPLEDYDTLFDPLFSDGAQRRGFREYLQGLLLPRDRNKPLTGVAGAEPNPQAHAAPVQSVQFFLSESTWVLSAWCRRSGAAADETGRFPPRVFGNTLLTKGE